MSFSYFLTMLNRWLRLRKHAVGIGVVMFSLGFLGQPTNYPSFRYPTVHARSTSAAGP